MRPIGYLIAKLDCQACQTLSCLVTLYLLFSLVILHLLSVPEYLNENICNNI